MTIACKKDNNDEVGNPPQMVNCPPLSGYTGTDASGSVIGPVDSTDWGTHDVWNQCEMDLFNGTNYNTNCTFYSDTTFHDTIIFVGSGPNPTANIFSFWAGAPHYADTSGNPVAIDSTMAFEMLLMNQRHEILVDTVMNQVTYVNFNFSFNAFPPSDTIFRIYYRFTDINNCVRMGHGDIIRP